MYIRAQKRNGIKTYIIVVDYALLKLGYGRQGQIAAVIARNQRLASGVEDENRRRLQQHQHSKQQGDPHSLLESIRERTGAHSSRTTMMTEYRYRSSSNSTQFKAATKF